MYQSRVYQASADIKEFLNIPYNIYLESRNCIINNTSVLRTLAQNFMLNSKKKWRVTPAVAVEVLNYISERCFPYGKPVECIRIVEICKGMPTLGIPGIEKSDRTIRYALRFLEKIGWIIRVAVGKGTRDVFYGPSMINILEGVWQWYQKCKLKGKSAEFRLERIQKFRELFKPFKEKFLSLVSVILETIEEWVETIKTFFCAELFEEKETNEDMLQQVIKKGIEKRKQKKREKQVEQGNNSFRGKKGSCNALYFFNSQVELRQPEVVTTTTGKEIGKMKNYLKELDNAGLSEDQIRERFVNIVEFLCNRSGYAFDHMYEKEEIAKTIRITIPDIPNFEFFYNFRKSLESMFIDFLQKNNKEIKDKKFTFGIKK